MQGMRHVQRSLAHIGACKTMHWPTLPCRQIQGLSARQPCVKGLQGWCGLSACRWPAKNSYGDPVEKRMVQTPDRRYDPDLVPPEWSQWLKMTRLEPPSEEEIAGCALLPAFLCIPGRLSFSYCSPTCNPEGTGGGPLL